MVRRVFCPASVFLNMRGRPSVGQYERIVNYAEYTAEAKYKVALLDLERRTGLSRHTHFRRALKEYLGKHNVEYFIQAAREEIAQREADVTEMQAQVMERNRENREHAEASIRRVLSEQVYLGVKIGGAYLEQLAGQIATRYQQAPEEMLEVCEAVHIEFIEKYGKSPKSIRKC